MQGQPIIDCSTIISLRLSIRSATTPPYGPSIRTGRVCSATAHPTSVAEPVSLKISHDCATDCIHVPVSEIACPVK